VSRWLALLISILGGAILGYALLLAVGGGLLGFLWLFVFGDDPWPAWSDYVLGTAIVVGGFAAWAWCSWMIWRQLRSRL
jgi:hypothetical protein